MVLNAAQINDTLTQLNQVLTEQRRILEDTRNVVITELGGCWECKTQTAYADVYVSLENNVLKQINSLIELFGTAFRQSQEGLYQVDVDMASMTSSVYTG